MNKSRPPADILIVDDTPANLQLLLGMLQGDGYRVRPVTSGEHALRAVRAAPPDLILLDITMPGMDGYEVCRRLKADPASAGIPILFISALAETEDKVRAFAAGGVDYVGKPFQIAEVLARVRTHLQLRQRERDLAESLARQHELERLRDSLTHMVAHDMRSPLLALRLTLGLLLDSVTGGDRETVEQASISTEALIGMINDMIDVSRLENSALVPGRETVELGALARDVLAATRLLAGNAEVVLDVPGPIQLEADPGLVRRILTNLVCNAYKFVRANGRISVRVRPDAAGIRTEVSDNGCGIAPEEQAHIFEKFGQVEGEKKRHGSGLGLTFAKLAVEAHGGAIGIDSMPGQGSTFWFTLPTVAPAEHSAPAVASP